MISEFLQKFNLVSTSLSGESAPDQSEIAIQWYNLLNLLEIYGAKTFEELYNILTLDQACKVTGSYEKQPLISEFLQEFKQLSTSSSRESALDQSEIAIQWYNLLSLLKIPWLKFFSLPKTKFL